MGDRVHREHTNVFAAGGRHSAFISHTGCFRPALERSGNVSGVSAMPVGCPMRRRRPMMTQRRSLGPTSQVAAPSRGNAFMTIKYAAWY